MVQMLTAEFHVALFDYHINWDVNFIFSGIITFAWIKNIVTCMGCCDLLTVWIGCLDLLTPYTHLTELQFIIAL
jgi:hypothetical protein